MYLFRDGDQFFILSAGAVFKMALPASGLGRAALATTIADCPPEARTFFEAMIEGERQRAEFEKRGAY